MSKYELRERRAKATPTTLALYFILVRRRLFRRYRRGWGVRALARGVSPLARGACVCVLYLRKYLVLSIYLSIYLYLGSGWAVPFVCVPRWHPSGALIYRSN